VHAREQWRAVERGRALPLVLAVRGGKWKRSTSRRRRRRVTRRTQRQGEEKRALPRRLEGKRQLSLSQPVFSPSSTATSMGVNFRPSYVADAERFPTKAGLPLHPSAPSLQGISASHYWPRKRGSPSAGERRNVRMPFLFLTCGTVIRTWPQRRLRAGRIVGWAGPGRWRRGKSPRNPPRNKGESCRFPLSPMVAVVVAIRVIGGPPTRA